MILSSHRPKCDAKSGNVFVDKDRSVFKQCAHIMDSDSISAVNLFTIFPELVLPLPVVHILGNQLGSHANIYPQDWF
jgi:hypothetical protein